MNKRDTILKKNISLGVLFKILNMGIAFLTIPILLRYLNTEQYGLWVTIFSIINVIIYIDGGISNGLKTKLSEALIQKDVKLAREYTSTAYISISIFSLLVFLLGSILIYSINFKGLLNTTVDENILKSTFFITLISMTIGYILILYKSMYYAKHKSYYVELSMFIYQCLNLLFIITAINFFQRSLVYVAIFYGVSTVFIGVLFSILFFRKHIELIPLRAYFKKEAFHDLFGLSVHFFIIQLCMIIIFSTDNLIISKFLGPTEVAKYDIVLKLFQVIITFTVIIQDPFWALYSNAYQKKDFVWIKQTIKRWNLLFIPFVLFVLVLVYFTKSLLFLWLQKDLEVSENLIIFMGVFIIIRVYGIIYMNFLNGIGKVKLQMYLYIIGAIINIPISIYFVKYLGLGSGGVILGTIISILTMSILLPIQTFKILKNTVN